MILNQVEISVEFSTKSNELDFVMSSLKLDLKVCEQQPSIQIFFFSFLVNVNPNFYKLLFNNYCVEFDV